MARMFLKSCTLVLAVLALAGQAYVYADQFTHTLVVTHVPGLKDSEGVVDKMIQSFKNHMDATDAKPCEVEHGPEDTIIVKTQNMADALLAKDLFLVHYDDAHTVELDGDVFKVPHGQERKRDHLSDWYHEAHMRTLERSKFREDFPRLREFLEDWTAKHGQVKPHDEL